MKQKKPPYCKNCGESREKCFYAWRPRECKKCFGVNPCRARKYRRDEKLAYEKRYREENRDYLRERVRTCRLNRGEKALAWEKAWRYKNREMLRQCRRNNHFQNRALYLIQAAAKRELGLLISLRSLNAPNFRAGRLSKFTAGFHVVVEELKVTTVPKETQ